VVYSLSSLVYIEAIILGKQNVTGDSIQTIAKHVNGIVFLNMPFAGLNLVK